MPEQPIAATGLLRAFAEAGMVQLVDFHLARRLSQLTHEDDPRVELAIALTSRELRLGSVCVDLATAQEKLMPESDTDDGTALVAKELPWPDPAEWLTAVAASPAVGSSLNDPAPLRLDGTLLYLDRYFRQERRLAAALRSRSAMRAAPITASPPENPLLDPYQNEAVRAAMAHPTTVITGGPGTGKTTIAARILTAMAGANPRVALSAPTGKATARLYSEVGAKVTAPLKLWGGTLHKLLGARPRSSHLEFDAANPLPYDVVIVDETSMVSLELMAQLLDAVAAGTRLILLGDPHQLRSVEAGAVLADVEAADDLVSAPGGYLVRLRHNYRSNEAINALAEAILRGEPEAARARLDADGIELVDFDGTVQPHDVPEARETALAQAREVQRHALAGDAGAANEALESHRLLCGHRDGPFGVSHWSRSLRGWLATRLDDYGFEHRAYAGQPLLITRNSDQLSNGDTGVVVRDGDTLTAVIEHPVETVRLPPQLLDDAEDLHAMTIHKSQGSQFDAVSVVLPPLGSPLLTRELVYTAVTRARQRVRLYGSLEALDAAVSTPVRRASGLGRR